LAEECEDANDALGAIKALETLIANAKTKAKCLPQIEARCRVKCASLLLKHTDNAHHAKTHLEAAQVLLKPLKRCEELRVHGLSLLGRTYKMMGNNYRRQRFSATQRGLQMAIGMRERAPEDARWTMWTFHYYLEHADACMVEEDWAGCENYLDAGLKVVRSIHKETGSKMEVLFAIAQLQRALAQRASGSEEHHVYAAAKSADEAMTKMLSEIKAPEDTARLRFHYYVTRTLGKLMEGDPLAAKNDPSKFKSLMDEVRHANTEAYRWLPDPAAFALAKYLSAEVVRPGGDLKRSMVYLTEAKDLVDKELHALGVLPQGGDAPVVKTEEDEDDDDDTERLWVTCEEEMQFRVAQDAKSYLYLRVLILESIVSVALTSFKYDMALDVACQMMDMIETYPQTLSLFASHVEMVAGHAMFALGKYKEASARFARSASLASTPSWRDIGTLCSALALTCCEEEDSASRALELVKPVVRSHKEQKSTSVLNQAFALFTSGCALREQGRLDDARNHLGRALKKTYDQSGNNQLLASCLRLICGIDSASDETKGMAESAFGLSKMQEDLPNQVAALIDLNRIYTAVPPMDERKNPLSAEDAEKMRQSYQVYENRKQKQYDDYMDSILKNETCVERATRLERGAQT
jgi:MAternally-affected-uncoordination protein